MSRKNIVLSSIQGGQSEILIHEKNGFLFDHQKNNDLSEKIRSITNKTTTELETIADAGLHSVLQKHGYDLVYTKKKSE